MVLVHHCSPWNRSAGDFATAMKLAWMTLETLGGKRSTLSKLSCKQLVQVTLPVPFHRIPMFNLRRQYVFLRVVDEQVLPRSESGSPGGSPVETRLRLANAQSRRIDHVVEMAL